MESLVIIALIMIIIGLIIITMILKCCKHFYEVTETVQVYSPNNSKTPKGLIYVQKCKHCGNLKRVKIESF